jgi:hypothetical protein
MPSVALAPLDKQQFFDDNGAPLAGGFVYTYAAGTTTDQATYTDYTGGSANTNPVELNARGEANIWLDSSLLYKFVLKTSAGVTIRTTDRVGVTATAPSFLAAGSGATARTVQDKERDVISVKDFGATGNGATNDRAAIALALTAASGKRLLFPPATYIINSALTIPDNSVIEGYGATLDFSGAGMISALTLGSNVKLVGLKIVGPTNASYDGNSFGIDCHGTDNTPLAPTYVTGPQIIDCEITEFAAYGVYMKYVNYAEIVNCKITECGYVGIGGLSCNRVNIEGNYIGQISPGTSGNAYGCFVDRSSGTLTADPRSNYVRIIGNMVEDVTIWHGIDTHAGNQYDISNNVIVNCKRGIVVTDSNNGATPTYGAKNVVVSGNVISGLATGNAIAVNGAGTPGSIADYAENVSVIGNTIEAGGVTADVNEGCIKIYGTRNLTVSGNTLRRPILMGIHLVYDNASFNISGNTIVDPNDTTQNSSCIAVTSNNNKGYIGGNTFVAENTGLATKVAERSVYNAGGTGNDIRCPANNNAFIGKATGRLDLSSFARAYTAADTTPSVANTRVLVVANAGSVTITNLDDGVEGQEVTLFFDDSNTTVDRTNALLSGGVNFVSTANDTLTLIKRGALWYEVGRGVNN